MKKYLFLTVFAAAALLMSGCNKDRTATVVYTDVPSPLTQMTYSESLPPDTYSEYMATYTSEPEASSDRHYFSMIGGMGIYADTRVTAPPADFGGGIGSLKRDTAVTTTTVPVTETDETEETVTCVPIGSETDIPEGTSEETSETTETTTGYTLARPKADTRISAEATRVSADTAQTKFSSTTKASETDEAETESPAE